MKARRASFTQRDLERLFKAAKRAGVPVGGRIEAATGDLHWFPVEPVAVAAPAGSLEAVIAGGKW